MSVDKLLDDRGSKYGNYLRQAKIVEFLWKVVSEGFNNKRIEADQSDALRMICVKMSRIVNGDPDYADNWRDIAGYAMLVADRLEGKSR